MNRCNRLNRTVLLLALFAIGHCFAADQPLVDDLRLDENRRQQALRHMDEYLNDMPSYLDLSEAQKTKAAAMKKEIAAQAAVHPAILDARDFETMLQARIREMLTPAQRAEFDAHLKSLADLQVEMEIRSRLGNIGRYSYIYANEHAGNMPGDFRGLFEIKTIPEKYLFPGSGTTVPDELANQDIKTQGDWVMKNTDFVYLGDGHTQLRAVSSYAVIAYVKPNVSPHGNWFAMVCGLVRPVTDPATAEKIIFELKEGRNPPPSWNLLKIAADISYYIYNHQDALPPDLGALTPEEDLTDVFLDGKMKVPDDFHRRDAKGRAEWVTLNSSFVYLGAGKKLKETAPGYVLAWIKPFSSARGNTFLMGDGNIISLSDVAVTEKIIGELKDGKNPPPSMPKKK
jgi:hypothetical protein